MHGRLHLYCTTLHGMDGTGIGRCGRAHGYIVCGLHVAIALHALLLLVLVLGAEGRSIGACKVYKGWREIRLRHLHMRMCTHTRHVVKMMACFCACTLANPSMQQLSLDTRWAVYDDSQPDVQKPCSDASMHPPE